MISIKIQFNFNLIFKYQTSILIHRIPIDLAPTVYCAAVYGSDQEWSFLWEKYKSTNSAAEKRTMLNALGCTQDINLLKVKFK